MTSDSTAKNSGAAAFTRRSSSSVLKLYHASSVVQILTETNHCVLLAMPPVIFVENGFISLMSVGLKVHQMMLLRLLSLRLFCLCTDLSLLLLHQV